MIETLETDFNSEVKSISGFRWRTFKNRKNNRLICKSFTVLRNSTFGKLKATDRREKIYKNTLSNASLFIKGNTFCEWTVQVSVHSAIIWMTIC